MKIVIRAGGIGSRLWPMSRVDNPKQFQQVVGEKSMIATTHERIVSLLSQPQDLFVSVNLSMKDRLLAELPDLPAVNIIYETDTRNTGPAMCLEACYLEKFCSPNDIIASLTSDDYISDSSAFCDLLLAAEEFVKLNPDYIITPAVKPALLDTGYSYFKAGNNLQKKGEEGIYSVIDIVEKPNYERCRELIDSGIYFCHTGMYVWRLGSIIELWQQNQPAMVEVCRQIVKLMTTGENYAEIKQLYSQLEKMTIETAITNKVKKIAMSVSNRIGWSDLGKWYVIKDILSPEEGSNLIKGKVIANKSDNNLIYSTLPKKIIATNDVSNLAIVDTGDVLFISSLEKSAEVKEIVEKLKEQGLNQYL